MRRTQYDYLRVIATACPATGAAAGIVMPHLDNATINVLLGQSSAGLAEGVHAVLIWDGAGFHAGGELVVSGNVSLIRLPPDSPELDPIENLWHYLRSHCWSNRSFADRESLREACSALVALGNDPSGSSRSAPHPIWDGKKAQERNKTRINPSRPVCFVLRSRIAGSCRLAEIQR